MIDDVQGRRSADREELGREFAAQNSPSFAGDLGQSFIEHNSSREEWIKRRHSGRRKLLWLAALGLLLLTIAIVFFSTRPKKTSVASRRGGTAAITSGQSTIGDINIYDDALGTATPVNTVTVYSQVTGKVIAVHYREGQYVHKGDPLVDIDPRPYEADLKQAEGTLERDRGVLAEAQIDLGRYQAAYAKNAIARQQLEDQEQAVVQDAGTVKADEGTVQYDTVELAYCHIVSPIDGRVGLRLVDPGNTVFSGNGSTLVVITQMQPMTVVFNVSEDDLAQIQTQLKANKTMEADAWDRDNTHKIGVGKLLSLDNQIDTTTGTLKFRARFDNKNLGLYPNEFVNIRLLVKTLKNVVLVPAAAVQQNGTAAFVYVVKSGAKGKQTVAVQGVTVLTSNENVAAVTGLQPGLTVATSGFDRLDVGMSVRVVKQASGNAPTPGATGVSSGGPAAGASSGSNTSTNPTSGSSGNGSSSPSANTNATNNQNNDNQTSGPGTSGGNSAP